MTNYYALGLASGLVFAAIFLLLRLAIRKNRGDGSDYDERQMLIRGRAYQAAFFTLLIYLAVCILLDAAVGLVWCDLGTAAFVGMALSVVVYVSVCLAQDAYFGLRQRPVPSLLLFGAVGLLQLYNGWRHIRDGELAPDGIVRFDTSAPLICGCLLTAMALVILVKLLVDGKRGGDDEES